MTVFLDFLTLLERLYNLVYLFITQRVLVFNLNIPRYIDVFEEEEPIDIKAVMDEIKELEAKRAELDKEIDVYLRELKLI
jgi:hypothetical protein